MLSLRLADELAGLLLVQLSSLSLLLLIGGEGPGEAQSVWSCKALVRLLANCNRVVISGATAAVATPSRLLISSVGAHSLSLSPLRHLPIDTNLARTFYVSVVVVVVVVVSASVSMHAC